jgi:hypothetical protein
MRAAPRKGSHVNWAQGFGGKLGHAIEELGDVKTPADIVANHTELDLRVRRHSSRNSDVRTRTRATEKVRR